MQICVIKSIRISYRGFKAIRVYIEVWKCGKNMQNLIIMLNIAILWCIFYSAERGFSGTTRLNQETKPD